MAYEVHDGYQKFRDTEPLILEPEDWSFDEWATICKLCGLPTGQTERIVLHASEMECFVDLSKKAVDGERTYIVTEVCPHCESEVEMRWNTDTMGFKAFCPVCGERLIIKQQVSGLGIKEPRNLEEKALSMVGPEVYEKLVKGYTEKQWGRSCRKLPPSIIRRLPLRFTFDNNYFTSRYQGIPIGGYNGIIGDLLRGSEVMTGTDYFTFRQEHPEIAERIVFTGSIDAFYEYRYGPLEYRSLRFDTSELQTRNFQGNAVVNFTDAYVPYTRIIEHKHFEFGEQPTTIITFEYPVRWEPGLEPFYPVNDETNMVLYEKYAALAQQEENVIFGGRLGSYRYYDMDQVIAAALDAAEKEV